MRLLIIRHAEPDYENDTLTEKGWHEAELLSERIVKLNEKLDIKEIYVSPLGRAKDTASLSLNKLGRTASECDWLQEFYQKRILRPDANGMRKAAWDWLPSDIAAHPLLSDYKHWLEDPLMAEGNIAEPYNYVTGKFSKLLADHGYTKTDSYFRVDKANNDTLAFFCHFGLECVLLSFLLNISPSLLWQGFCAAPSSITEVLTEERRKGIAQFRVAAFGDTSHLYAGAEEVSTAARFCESFDNTDERHD